MGAPVAPASGAGTFPRHDGQEHPFVCRSGAVAGPLRGVVAGLARRTFWALAYGLCPFPALAAGWRVGPCASAGTECHGLRPAVGGFDCRAGAPGSRGGEKKDSPVGQALGRSRGGFTTKLHLSCDAQGRICALALTGGQAGDCPQAPGLLAQHLRVGQAVLADRAYDAGYVRAQIQQAGAMAVIPSKKNRTILLPYDADLYKERNQIERAINRLKCFRAVATRFDKRAANYFATCCLVAALTWL